MIPQMVAGAMFQVSRRPEDSPIAREQALIEPRPSPVDQINGYILSKIPEMDTGNEYPFGHPHGGFKSISAAKSPLRKDVIHRPLTKQGKVF